MAFNLSDLQQYIFQVLYSLYRRRNLVLTIILLSTIIVIVSSQFSSLPANKDSQDAYNERSQYFVQDNRYERLQDVNLFRKSLDENNGQDSDRNEVLQAANDENQVKAQNAKMPQNANLVVEKNEKPKHFIPELRIVHIDLKGAPPKLEYLKRIFRLVKEAGGNAILLEYEDVSLILHYCCFRTCK